MVRGQRTYGRLQTMTKRWTQRPPARRGATGVTTTTRPRQPAHAREGTRKHTGGQSRHHLCFSLPLDFPGGTARTSDAIHRSRATEDMDGNRESLLQRPHERDPRHCDAAYVDVWADDVVTLTLRLLDGVGITRPASGTEYDGAGDGAECGGPLQRYRASPLGPRRRARRRHEQLLRPPSRHGRHGVPWRAGARRPQCESSPTTPRTRMAQGSDRQPSSRRSWRRTGSWWSRATCCCCTRFATKLARVERVGEEPDPGASFPRPSTYLECHTIIPCSSQDRRHRDLCARSPTTTRSKGLLGKDRDPEGRHSLPPVAPPPLSVQARGSAPASSRICMSSQAWLREHRKRPVPAHCSPAATSPVPWSAGNTDRDGRERTRFMTSSRDAVRLDVLIRCRHHRPLPAVPRPWSGIRCGSAARPVTVWARGTGTAIRARSTPRATRTRTCSRRRTGVGGALRR